MGDILIRFFVGGAIVSVFAVMGDLFKPKSFAGLFGAAPSVAIATLGLTLTKHSGAYAAIEGRSMVIGAIALFAYSQLACWLLMRPKWRALPAAALSLGIWFIVTFGLWALFLR